MGRQGRVGGSPPQGPVPVLAGLMDGNGCSIGTHILSYKPARAAGGCRNPPAAVAIDIDRRPALRLEREHRTEGGRAAMARNDAANLSPGNVLKSQIVRIDFHVVAQLLGKTHRIRQANV